MYINLLDLPRSRQQGLIVKSRLGCLYANQTHGYRCHQSEQRGFFVPLSFKIAPELVTYFKEVGRITPEHQSNIDEILKAWFLLNEGWLWHKKCTVRLDPKRLNDSGEAWLHVIVEHYSPVCKKRQGGYLKQFKAILTWGNSD